MEMCSSSRRCHLGDMLLTLGTLPSGSAPHPGVIVLGVCSSHWGHDVHPGTSSLGCSLSLGNVSKPQPYCHFTLLLPWQELVLEPAAKRSKAENTRHANVLKQANHHHSTVLKQWRSLCRLLTSPRSAWADR